MSHFAFGQLGALTGNDQYTKILLHMDGANGGTAFADSALGTAHTWTAASVTTSSTQSKFGGASMLDGAAGGITTPDSADFTLGSSDFTVDCWFYVSGGAGAPRVLCSQNNSAADNPSTSLQVVITPTNTFAFGVGQGSTFVQANSTTAYTASGWHHLAGVRSGNFLKLFLDGVQEGGDVSISGSVNDSANKWGVGVAGEFAGVYWNGFIDEFRLSVGIARWTANFTPPVIPYG